MSLDKAKLPPEENKAFDLEVHKFDPKTGKLLSARPYSYTVSQDDGAWFTRGGVRYNPDGSLKDKAPEPQAVSPAPIKGRVLESKIS